MVGTFFVLLPMSIAMAIRMVRRPMRNKNRIESADDERLTRLEQSIDAIAIEMERVSEGQRYVTKLLAGTNPSSVGFTCETRTVIGARVFGYGNGSWVSSITRNP